MAEVAPDVIIKETENNIYITKVGAKGGGFERYYKDNKIAGTLTTQKKDVKVIEDWEAIEEYLLESRTNIKELFHNTFNAENYITGIGTEREREREGENHTIGTLTASGANSRQKIFESLVPLKIRSLTPRESLRLMGWKDNQIDKVIDLPKTKLYFTAGNSMVIPVMKRILIELLMVGLKEE